MLENNKNNEGTALPKDIDVSALRKNPELRKTPEKVADEKKTAAAPEAKKTEPVEESATATNVVANDGNETDEEANEAEGTVELEEQTRQKVGKGVQKKIDKLTKKAGDAERERDELKAQLAALKSGSVQAEKPTEQATSNFNEKEPELDDFGNISDYVKAHSAWTLKKYEVDRAAKDVATAQEKTYKETVGEFNKRGKALETELQLTPGEFNAVVGDDDFKLFEGTQGLLLTSEHGARIAYEIASNDETAKHVMSLSPVKQLAYVAKLEAKYEASSEVTKPAKQKETQVSKAKKPPSALPKGNVTVGAEPPKGDLNAYRQWRKEQREAKGKGWR